KDVLSGCFGLLSLICYARYVQVQSLKSKVQSHGLGGNAPRSTLHASRYYLLSLCFFALGLMSKPMLVTWPFVLLLLDYWPLRRFEISTPNSQLSTIVRLVKEKIPFFT